MTVTRLRSPIALLVGAALALFGAAAAPSASATGGHGGHHGGEEQTKPGQETCPDGGGWTKTDIGGERTSVEVQATEGFVIVEYCVKASTEVEFHDVEPGQETVVIASPATNGNGETQAISHYSVREVPVEEAEEPTYPAPVCEGGVTVTYPEGSQGQGWNHVNVTVENLESDEEVTLNFHNDADDWSGVVSFDATTHADWPGWEHYAYTWVQVAGTDLHWGETGEEPVVCGEKPEEPGTPEEPEEPTEPTLEGSIVSTDCIADAPWITYDVRVTPADAELDDRTAELVLTDGTRTETITLGELGEDGTLAGRTLWPGAEVAEDGVTPIAWPGWERLDDGTWVETDENFAWTREGVTATLVVNPDLAVENFAYPPPTSACANPPQDTETPGTPAPTEPVDQTVTPAEPGDTPSDEAPAPAAAGDDELPQTGSDVLIYALVAFVLLAVGGTVLVVRRRV
ncbi:LPXTG cell wall anchor domain-containing protein [Isoptericola sp. BMS4]|uniref:LPXTG cell wall anchor domain-containing protein n=1 Tax=Isoptericola sp. BMS4 TaxID=2527875 RepID=UPI0014201383|nr:LPXTG cell wall anchor domain-containing protein [Isoptericola sp. BMS4]